MASRRSRERANSRPWEQEKAMSTDQCQTCVHVDNAWDVDCHCALFVMPPTVKCDHQSTDVSARKVALLERCPNTGDMFDEDGNEHNNRTS